MICPHCKQNIPDGLVVCFHCSGSLIQNGFASPIPESTKGVKQATVSKIMGIITLATSLLFIVSIPTGIIGIIYGIASLKEYHSEKSKAKMGIILSVIGLIITVLLIIAYAMGWLDSYIEKQS